MPKQRHLCTAGQLGWNGVDDIMSGRDNYLSATSPEQNPSAHRRARQAGIARTNLKRWTVGSPIQAPRRKRC
jgi:hypothetical protein